MLCSFLISLGIACGCLLAARILIHYFQLESYQFPGYFRTIRRNFRKAVLPGCFLSAVLLLLMILFFMTDHPLPGSIAIFVVLPAVGYAAGKLFSEKTAKKALAFTPRIKRLYAVSAVILFLILFLICSAFGFPHEKTGTADWPAAAVLVLFPALLPLWTAFCGLLAWPIEKGISEMYFRDAQRILRSREDLVRIGITGSWGKTSVKFILGTLLEEKYHTLVTPASYNTPMGVTKVIRTMLEPGHRVFVSEMGARHVGDIREMCRLVHPVIGILTSVGPQHLDTFKTVDRVKKTKYELIEALPSDGAAFFADDGGICRELYEKTEIRKMISGLDPQKDDVWAEEISVSESGSTFYLCTENGRQQCRTSLLGELNIRNILLCACVCLHLGMTPEQIAMGIEKLTPVEHRLQLIPNPGGLTVIDDAFNSNILGARQAFKVLKEMKGTRFLVTPGMVELGGQEEEMNRAFGRDAAGCCDKAILVGKKRSAAIANGLKDGGFREENILIAASLDEATGILQSLVRPGDTVLFENDLPDNYSE